MAEEKKTEEKKAPLDGVKLVDDNEKTFTVERKDGKQIEVAKTDDTHPIYKLLSATADVAKAGTDAVDEKHEEEAKDEEKEKRDEPAAAPAPDIAIARRVDTPSAQPTLQELGSKSGQAAHDTIVDFFRPGGTSRLMNGTLGEYMHQGDAAQMGAPAALAPNRMNEAPTQVPGNSPMVQSPQQAQAAASVAPPTPEPTQQIVAPDQSGTPTAPNQPSAAPSVPQQVQTSEQDTRMSPDTRQAMGSSDKAQQNYQNAFVDAETQKQKMLADKATAEGNLARYHDDQIAALNLERDKNIRLKLAEIDQVAHKFAGMSVDSGRFFGDGLTGRKVLASIGLALGALGQGLNGQKNAAIDIIDKAIDRDIEVQKANINKVGKEYEMLRGGLRDYMSVTHDMETAMLAEKARGLDGISKGFEAIAAANPNAAIKAKAAEMAAVYQQKKFNTLAQVEKNVYTTQTIMGSPKATADVRERTVNGVGLALSKEAADKVREEQLNYNDARKGLKDLLEINALPAGKSIDLSLRKKAETTANLLQGALRTQILGPGTVNEHERALLNKIIANPTKIFSLDSTNRTALQTVLDKVESHFQNAISAYMDQSTVQHKPKIDFNSAAAKKK